MYSPDSLITGELFIGIPLIVALILLLMRPRRFYFVRHGETLLNAEHIRQGAEGALSEKGRAQAEEVGRYLHPFRVNMILSSTYPRAKETSEILRTHLNAPISYSDLLVERRNPTDVVGKSSRDPKVTTILSQIDLAYHADDFRISDEESFDELKSRARKCVDLLAAQGENGTVIVTHHIFLKACVAYMLYRERLHAGDFVKLSFFNYSDNAGVTTCEFNPWRIFSPTRGWRIVSYNEKPEK